MTTITHRPGMGQADTLGNGAATADLLAAVGWESHETRSATSILVDHGFQQISTTDDDLVVMPLADALVTYPWVQDLVFGLIDPEQDETLRRAFESTRTPLGTFTWVKDGAHVELPAQSFTVMTVPQERQFVHDITVYGAGSIIDTVSGSAVAPGLTRGHHVSVSETYVGEGAQVRSISVDRWGRNMKVHTYNRTRVAAGASLNTVSVAVSGLRKQVDDSLVEVGANASCIDHSIVLAPEGTERIIRSVVDLVAEGARTEQVARMVSDGGVIRNDSVLVGSAPGVRGFLECDGLMLRDTGRLESVPALDAKVDRAQLSHEASVGMVDNERLDYLMATGMDEDSARDLIVQGFLNFGDDRIPASVRETVERLIEAARGAEKM